MAEEKVVKEVHHYAEEPSASRERAGGSMWGIVILILAIILFLIFGLPNLGTLWGGNGSEQDSSPPVVETQ